MREPAELPEEIDGADWEQEAEEARNWVRELGISDGERPDSGVTRRELWVMLKRLEEKR